MHGPGRVRRTHGYIGFSLVELIVAMALGLVLLAAAGPSFLSMRIEQRMATVLDLLLTDIHLARIEAIKRHRNVVLCRSSDGRLCQRSTGNRVDWSFGRIVYVDTDGDAVRDPGEPLLQARSRLPDGLRLSFNQWWRVVYRSDGSARNGTFSLCHERGIGRPRALILYYTGRPRISGRQADGDPIRCG